MFVEKWNKIKISPNGATCFGYGNKSLQTYRPVGALIGFVIFSFYKHAAPLGL
jgi:hypothetical protein